MANIDYAPVSSMGQTLDAQLDRLEYCNENSGEEK